MNKNQEESGIMMWVLLAFPVAWMGAVMAYAYEDGMNLFQLLEIGRASCRERV